MIYHLQYLKDPKKQKFYTITCEQNTVTIHFGRVGTKGTQQITTYGSLEEAEKVVKKKLVEKQKKGYQIIDTENYTTPQNLPLEETFQSKSTPSKTAEIQLTATANIDTQTPFNLPLTWQYNSNFSSFGLAVEQEYCWLGNETGKVLKFDAQGQLLAQYQLPYPVKTIVSDDIWVYVGCNNGKVYDMTGKLPYIAYETEGNFDIFCLDVDDGILGVSDGNGGITIIDPEGEILWSRLSPGKMGWMLCSDAQGFYHGHTKGVTMYDLKLGRQLWHQTTVGKVLFGCHQGDFLYVATSGKKIYCFRKNSDLVTTYDCESSVYACAVTADNHYVYGSDNSGFIYCFQQTGERLWKAKLGCGSALSLALSQGDRLYLATNTGILACADVSPLAIAEVAGNATIIAPQTRVIPTEIEVKSSPPECSPSAPEPVLLECFKQGDRLRVRVLSEGYHQDWMVQFPRHLRQEGDRYLVSAIKAAKQGEYYRIHGDIQRID